MKKFVWPLIVSSFLLMPTAFAAESLPQKTPPSAEYLQWMQEQDVLLKKGTLQKDAFRKETRWGGEAVEIFPTGTIPEPADWSHLANNPPVSGGVRGLEKAFNDPLPSSYDLRNFARLPAVRDQSPFGTCWAHAAIGASESSAITKVLAAPTGANAINLSEMHLAWFTYGDSREGKSFNRSGGEILDQGGNSARAIAFLSRQGAIPEADLSYPTRANYVAPAGVPEDYAPSFQLVGAYNLGSVNAANRDTVKRMIREHGAVHITYHSNQAKDYCPDNPRKTYGNCNGRTTYYTTDRSANHGVLAVGWDDNFSRGNFRPGEQPASNGAWLVRNSWGSSWGMGGYFWMSYEQYIDNATVYIVEAADNRLRLYGYDDLGYTGSTLPMSWSANIFRAQGNEAVEEVAFHTTDNNAQYNVYVYDLGTAVPTSPTTGGTLLAQKSGSLSHAGYHRLSLPTLAYVNAGHYFSVVVKLDGSQLALEDGDYSPAAVNAGESWYSSNGSSWVDLSARFNSNATIKAFTSVQAPGPVINTEFLSEGTVGEAYDAQLQATGTNITWTLDNGALPRGLNLSAAGRISGTPTTEGTYGFTVKATNSANRSSTKALSIRIKENIAATAPTITTAALPNASVGTAYSYTLEATGAAPIIWSASSKPAWMSVSSDGNITGTPTATGTFSVTLTARNDAGTSQPKTLTLKVGSVPAIATAGLPMGTVGTAYSALLVATGTTPITWTTISGALPNGLNISGDRITGTPSAQGSFTFTLQASNDWGSATKTLTITVSGASVAPPAITTTSLPSGTVGVAYSHALAATGTAPITWSASGLPNGLSVSGDRITGTPTQAGTFQVTLTASNSARSVSKTLTLTIANAAVAPAITTTSLPSGTVGVAYSHALAATGTAPITWSASGLPNGLSVSGDRITGTPTQAGTFYVTLTASNSARSASKTLTLTIANAAVAPAITTTSLPGGTVGVAYSHALAATGTAPITWSASGLPNGLSVSGDRITGTPTQAGTFYVTLTASNSVRSASKTLTLYVGGASQVGVPPEVTTRGIPGGTVGVPYGGVTLTASGTQPVTWSLLSGLPPGLTLSPNGVIGGTPTTAGIFAFTVQVRNDWGTSMQTLGITIKDGSVAPIMAPAIATDALPNGTVGKAYSAQLDISGAQPITLSAQGLPSWLTLYGNGLLYGQPTQAGTYTFTVRATNSAGSVSKTLRIVVSGAAVDVTALPAGKLNEVYSLMLQTTGTASPVVWGAVSGTLPPGVSLYGNGELYGRPTQTGTFTFTVKAMSSTGAVTRTLSITVTP